MSDTIAKHPLTPEQRRERAKRAAEARYAKRQQLGLDWHTMPLDAAEERIARMREELTTASRIVQQRVTAITSPSVKCHTYKREMESGKYAMSKAVRDLKTGLLNYIYFCTGTCVARYNLATQGREDLPR